MCGAKGPTPVYGRFPPQAVFGPAFHAGSAGAAKSGSHTSLPPRPLARGVAKSSLHVRPIYGMLHFGAGRTADAALDQPLHAALSPYQTESSTGLSIVGGRKRGTTCTRKNQQLLIKERLPARSQQSEEKDRGKAQAQASRQMAAGSASAFPRQSDIRHPTFSPPPTRKISIFAPKKLSENRTVSARSQSNYSANLDVANRSGNTCDTASVGPRPGLNSTPQP